MTQPAVLQPVLSKPPFPSTLALLPVPIGSTPLACEIDAVHQALERLDAPVWVVRSGSAIGVLVAQDLPGESLPASTSQAQEILAILPPCPAESLGTQSFCASYGLKYAYMSGAMANGIASARLVIALGKAGMLGSFGAAGLPPEKVESAIREIQTALPDGPYAFNLINSPNDPAAERENAELFVRYHVPVVEASAYLGLTEPLIYYRVSGLEQTADGQVVINHHVIAKLSRKEIARRFMEPPSDDLLNRLLKAGKITPLQAELARRVPVADDITVEADSGGHTDNRPLVNLLPAILAQRDEIQAERGYPVSIRVGAAGGIATPAAVHAAFEMGAAYVVTGSINQGCIEAAASAHTRALLAQAEMTDVIMAPAADMFEMGVKVQVLKRGTMFGMRALKLSELYNRYNSIEDLPAEELQKLETSILKRKVGDIWADTQAFFIQRDPKQLERAENDPHQKMALIFRWYLGLSSRWSNTGEVGREMDYQVWCGPAMGAFNQWTRGTYLENFEQRSVVNVARQLLYGAAYLKRVSLLDGLGFAPASSLRQVRPQKASN